MKCTTCNHLQYQYHSCRNRHCPSCQGSNREEWVKRQQQYLLDVPYFHVVFTLPAELRPLCLHNPRLMYGILFKASWETIRTLSADHKFLGAQAGMTAVLHTWSQTLGLHPHLHCIVPGGGLAANGACKYTRSKGKYLFPRKVMAAIFRAIYMRELKRAAGNGSIKLTKALRRQLYAKDWVVYAKRPFSKPKHVIEYLGRYTHKIAISNYRIIGIEGGLVRFKWKDYRHASKVKVMELPIREFMRRFALHILPHRFVRIRHYGILSYHARHQKIADLQAQQNYTPEVERIVDRPSQAVLPRCEKCKSTALVTTILKGDQSRSP